MNSVYQLDSPSAFVRPYPGRPGAEIEGVDLSRPLGERLAAAIRSAFVRHKLLVFRAQSLSREEIVNVCSIFGAIEGHNVHGPDGRALSPVHEVSNVDANGQLSRTPHINANYYWHSDKAHYRIPSLLTLLHAVELPPSGGETEFADMELGYEELPLALRSRIDSMKVVNDFEYAMLNAGKVLKEGEKVPSVTHPIVRTHPETGRRSLFVGMYSKGIEGMPEAEAQGLLSELLAHCTRPGKTFAHTWQLGDVVMWDNRSLIHRAVKNYEITQHRRVLLRCVVKGTHVE
jgi:alpha-ketoglutarate-dependent taurine dioxygenase